MESCSLQPERCILPDIGFSFLLLNLFVTNVYDLKKFGFFSLPDVHDESYKI